MFAPKWTVFSYYGHYLYKIAHYCFRKWCDEVTLIKGFRYEITVYHYGNGYNPEYFRLGVKFPDDSEVKPISKEYLRRSMGRYFALKTGDENEIV